MSNTNFPTILQILSLIKDGSDGVHQLCFRSKVFTTHMSLVLYVRFELQTIQISEAFHILEKI